MGDRSCSDLGSYRLCGIKPNGIEGDRAVGQRPRRRRFTAPDGMQAPDTVGIIPKAG